jgi:hypothetical protein
LRDATQRGGGAGHHLVLLWQAPHLLVALAIGSLNPRWLRIALVAPLVGSNLFVINEHIYKLQRNGARGTFTDAIYSLSSIISSVPIVCVADWGMSENLLFLTEGHIELRQAGEILFPNVAEAFRDGLVDWLRDPSVAWVTRVEAEEMFKGNGARLDELAASVGLEKKSVRVITDLNRRPVFEIRRYGIRAAQ